MMQGRKRLAFMGMAVLVGVGGFVGIQMTCGDDLVIASHHLETVPEDVVTNDPEAYRHFDLSERDHAGLPDSLQEMIHDAQFNGSAMVWDNHTAEESLSPRDSPFRPLEAISRNQTGEVLPIFRWRNTYIAYSSGASMVSRPIHCL